MSSRQGFISFFHREDDCRLYVFNQSVEKLQTHYKTPLRPLILKSGVIYMAISEAKVVAAGIRFGNPLLKREWGYEQVFIKEGRHSN